MYEVVKERYTLRCFCYVTIIPYCMHKFLSIDLSLLQGRSSEESGFIILLAYLNIMEKKLRR